MDKQVTKENVVGLITVVVVQAVIWVLAPLLGKYIDSFYFHYPYILAHSVFILLSGICIIIIGTLLGAWTVILFKVKGKGTPNPAFPPKEFIVTGPYKFTRNPMVMAGLIILIGESIFYYSPSTFGFAILFIISLYLYIRYVEEPELKKRFGQPYDDYLKKVPRFLPNRWK
jgi:protein-S-isoprenylcysteine O-methyltransferase Ste14